MGLLSGIIGGTAHGVGTAYDYLTPGKGSSTLTNVGKAITDPNVVLSNPTGIFTKAPAFTPVTAQPSGVQADTGQSTQQQAGGAYTGGGAYGGDSGTSAADYQAQQAALLNINQGLNSARDALGRLDSQRQTGLGNIDKQYQSAYDRLMGQQGIAERNYNNGVNSQLNDYLANRNNVATNARTWLDNARRTLGANGAGGGSAARYGVAFDAQNQAAQGNAQAQATNNKNIFALNQGYQDNKDNIQNAISDVQRQKTQGVNDYLSQVEQQRAQLLDTIAQLTGQQTIANGGNYQAALNAANPYTSQLPAIMAKIDSLAATPAITPQQVTLTNPDLSQYNWANPQTAPTPQQDPSLSDPNNNVVYDPYAQDQRKNPILGLFGLDPNQQQNQLLPA